MLSDQGTAFRKALLVEFPRPGCWTIAFLTGTPADAVVDHLPGEHVSVYVPTTPNPTGGYFVMVPKEQRARARHVASTTRSSTSSRWAWFLRAAGLRHPAPGRRRRHCRHRRRNPQPAPETDRRGAVAPWRAVAPRSVGAARIDSTLPTIRPQRPLENALKRTDYCGRIDRRYLGADGHADGLGAPPPRPRRRHLRRPARPRRPRADRVQSRPRRRRFAAAEIAAQRVRDPRDGPRAAAPRGRRQSEPRLRRDRGARARHRDPQRGADAAVPARRREPVGDRAPAAPGDRPAPPADAEEPDAAPPRGDGRAQVPRRARLHRHRDARALQVDARRRARVPRAVAHPSRHVLRAAAVAAALQADADDRRASTATTRSSSASATRTCAPTASPSSRRSTSRRRSSTSSRSASIMEGLVRAMFQEALGVDLPDPFPGDAVRRRDARLRLGQARPARAAQADRAHRSHAARSTSRCSAQPPTCRTGASRRCAFPAAAR